MTWASQWSACRNEKKESRGLGRQRWVEEKEPQVGDKGNLRKVSLLPGLVLLNLSYILGNWGIEKLNNLLSFTLLVWYPALTWTHIAESISHALSFHFTWHNITLLFFLTLLLLKKHDEIVVECRLQVVLKFKSQLSHWLACIWLYWCPLCLWFLISAMGDNNPCRVAEGIKGIGVQKI